VRQHVHGPAGLHGAANEVEPVLSDRAVATHIFIADAQR
jgi:hypothetical protein